jgi:hypothetical protein
MSIPSVVVALEVSEISKASTSKELEPDPTINSIESLLYIVSDMILWLKNL